MVASAEERLQEADLVVLVDVELNLGQVQVRTETVSQTERRAKREDARRTYLLSSEGLVRGVWWRSRRQQGLVLSSRSLQDVLKPNRDVP